MTATLHTTCTRPVRTGAAALTKIIAHDGLTSAQVSVLLVLLLRDGTLAATRLPDAVLQGRATPGAVLRRAAAPVLVPGSADLPSCVGVSLTYMPAAGLFVVSLQRVAGDGPGWLVTGRPVHDARLLGDITLASQPPNEVRQAHNVERSISSSDTGVSRRRLAPQPPAQM